MRRKAPFRETFEIESDDPYEEYKRYCEGVLAEMSEDGKTVSPIVRGMIWDYIRKSRKKDHSRPVLWMKVLGEYLTKGSEHVSGKYGKRIETEVEMMISCFENGIGDSCGLYDMYLFWKRYYRESKAGT